MAFPDQAVVGFCQVSIILGGDDLRTSIIRDIEVIATVSDDKLVYYSNGDSQKFDDIGTRPPKRPAAVLMRTSQCNVIIVM